VPTPMSETVLVSGRRVEVWNDRLFGGLRRMHGVSDDFLQTLDFGNRMEKASKSKEPLFCTHDEEFIVKAMSRSDHQSLLGLTEAYARRFEQGSLLIPIYLHFRFYPSEEDQDRNMGWMSYIAMRNLTPRAGTWKARYDLKACDDDKQLEVDGVRVKAVHKRFWHFWYCRCCWSPERWRYYNAKRDARAFQLQMPEAQRNQLLELIRGDVRWLMERGLMDYSLILGVQRLPRDAVAEAASASAGTCRLFGGRQCFAFIDPDPEASELPVTVVTVGIIDFLQTWTLKKQMASCCKLLEHNRATIAPDLYGERFRQHFMRRLEPSQQLQAAPGW